MSELKTSVAQRRATETYRDKCILSGVERINTYVPEDLYTSLVEYAEINNLYHRSGSKYGRANIPQAIWTILRTQDWS